MACASAAGEGLLPVQGGGVHDGHRGLQGAADTLAALQALGRHEAARHTRLGPAMAPARHVRKRPGMPVWTRRFTVVCIED